MKIVKPKVGRGKGNDVSQFNCIDFRSPIAKHRGNSLPHWFQDGKLQFVTFRLADSLPQSELAEIERIRKDIKDGSFLISGVNTFDYIEEIEYWLRQGCGSCILQYEEIQKIVEDALRYYDGTRWALYEYVIMPNHVHIIVQPFEDLNIIMKLLFQYTTRLINKVLSRRGSIWHHDYFDRMIRDINDYNEKAEYINQNPQNWIQRNTRR